MFSRGMVVAALVLGMSGLELEARGQAVGDAAPALKVSAWASEQTVSAADLKGRPYVLEFWATWCPPCRASIPHLNELWQKVGPLGVPIIGVSDEDLETVKPFMKKMNMLYHVGINDGMAGSPEGSIPYAYLVDADGKVAWAGHPMDPELVDNLFALAAAFRKDAPEAVASARDGKLHQAYQSLEKLGTEESGRSLKSMARNLQESLGFAKGLEGVQQHQALEEILDLYRGFPAVASLPEMIAALEADPTVAKALHEQKQLQGLEQRIESLREKAMALEKTSGRAQATTFYLKNLIPLMKEFVQANASHPAVPELQKAVESMEKALERMGD